MHICRYPLLPLLVCFSLLVVSVGKAQTSKAAPDAAAGSAHRAAAGDDDLRTSIAFRFDVLDLLTNHQFAGQKNSFHV